MTRPAIADAATQDPATPAAPHPCDVCPTRSIAQNRSFGYCEGCPSRLRYCQRCDQFQPQTDWGWGVYGLVFGAVGWLCAGCRWREPDRAAEHPRFERHLELDERTTLLLAHELGRAAERERHHPAHAILERMARSVRETGSIDVDVSDFGQRDRVALLSATARLTDNLPADCHTAGYAVHQAWAWFVEASAEPLPVAPREPTTAERVAALGWERDAG